MKDLAGAGRSGFVTLKVAKFLTRDQQVWQLSDFPRKNASFGMDLAGEAAYSRARTEALGSSSRRANR